MKAVFFDFDGTLTYKSPNIWKAIWQNCGYDTSRDSYFAMLYKMFLSSQITHQEWCDLTCYEFRKAGFNYDSLISLAKNLKLIGGIDETLRLLKEQGFHLFIVSGSIESVIFETLGDKTRYFDGIFANKMHFDEKGLIDFIEGTEYDFEGKAKFIDDFKTQTKSRPGDLFFVGNSNNDEWAHQAGCRTICINPEDADVADFKKWNKNVGNTNNLNIILPNILQPFKTQEN